MFPYQQSSNSSPTQTKNNYKIVVYRLSHNQAKVKSQETTITDSIL